MKDLLTVENLSKAGVVTLLIIVLVTGATGVWVWGSTYSEVKAERDEWKKVALDGLRVAQTVSRFPIPVMSLPSDSDVKPDDITNSLNLLETTNDN